MEADDAITVFSKEQDASNQAPAPGARSCPQCGLNVPLSVSACPKDGTLIDDTLGEGRKLVGNYEFLEFIGSGGMGVIYKAKHPVLKRIVAIKMLHSHLMSDVITKRFQQEAEAVSGLSHRCIISVHDFGVSEHGQPYMVMDFVDGKPLSEVLRMGILPLEAVINIGIQLAEALMHAHQHGVLHRDLKPSNIMISDYDCAFPLVKIVDFGIAKIMEADATKVTQTGELIGTPQYMSPEQCSGGELDARSDIYSLGCVLFEAITGKPPFGGESMVAIIVDQISKPARTLAEVRPDIVFPVRLEDTIARALAKDPADRQQSMSVFFDDLVDVQKIVCRPESERTKFWRAFRLNREQRNLVLISIASVLSLLAVAGSACMFINLANKSRQSTVQSRAREIDSAIEKVLLEQRSKTTRYLDPQRLDDRFVRHYFAEDLGITALQLSHSMVTDMSMVAVSRQRELRFLGLDWVPLSDAGATYIRPLKKLIELHLEHTKMTDEGLRNLSDLKNLQTLSLHDNKITDQGLEKLKGLPLKFLDLSQTEISDAGLEKIASLQTLEGLVLRDCPNIKGNGLKYLCKLPKLASLDVGGLALNDAAFADLGSIKPLLVLVLSKGIYSLRSIEELSHLERLNCLNLGFTNADTSWVPALSKISSLRELDLNSTTADGKMLLAISQQMPNLGKLFLSGTNLKDSDLDCLVEMKSLVRLDLRQTHVTEKGIELLKSKKKTPGLNFKVYF